MRILHVIPSYYPAVRYGGAVLATHGLCAALAGAGHEVHVFTSNRDGDGSLDVPLDRPVDVQGVQVHYHRLDGPRRLYHSATLVASLARHVSGFDIVHGHSLFLNPVDAAARQARRVRVPFLLSPRGMLVKALFRRRSAVAKWLWLWARGRRQIETASALHLTSELEAREARRFGLALPPCLVVPNGISPPLLPPAQQDSQRDPRRILFLGRLSWKKGIDVLIEALVALPDHHLRVVGADDESLMPDLQALAERLGVAARVAFAGPVSTDERWCEYRAAGVFVLPSMSENFANTVLEAMSMACPVVVSQGVGLSELVHASGAGMVCEPRAMAVAECVGALSSDPCRASAMGASGRAAVLQGYLWPDVANSMGNAYSRVMQRGGSQAA